VYQTLKHSSLGLGDREGAGGSVGIDLGAARLTAPKCPPSASVRQAMMSVMARRCEAGIGARPLPGLMSQNVVVRETAMGTKPRRTTAAC
jgi:hypothetical protein